jgi:hypothetical protein
MWVRRMRIDLKLVIASRRSLPCAMEFPDTKGKGSMFSHGALIYVGDDLLSHTLSRAVQSAQQGLTSVFGMGTGVSPAVRSPAT